MKEKAHNMRQKVRPAGTTLLVLTFIAGPETTVLRAVGPSFPGEPTIDPLRPTVPLSSFGWIFQWHFLLAIVILTVIGTIAALLIIRALQARQRRKTLGEDQLELLTRHTEHLERLYRNYARIFPEQIDLWSQFGADEAKHARWARELYDRIDGGEVLFQADLFPVRQIESSLRDLEACLSQIPETNPDLREALRRAGAVEKERFEWQIPDYFSGPDRAMQGVALFHAEIMAHLDRLNHVKGALPSAGDRS